ncbi:hypothetical protein [Cellulomonas sp. Leaf395]|uniref:hypothetical protein n=1 Tax=Cellulomonas sp. Leaf395 TaxID=1736362 RepID=UPI0012F75704|nr:hypothetical protein [Cellulomonas sp. Leaf395]
MEYFFMGVKPFVEMDTQAQGGSLGVVHRRSQCGERELAGSPVNDETLTQELRTGFGRMTRRLKVAEPRVTRFLLIGSDPSTRAGAGNMGQPCKVAAGST